MVPSEAESIFFDVFDAENMNCPPPAFDARHARRLVYEINTTLDSLEETYAAAKRDNDAGLFNQFNKLRENVQTQVDHLKSVRDQFPESEHEKINEAIDRAEHALKQVDPVNDSVGQSADA